MLFTQQTYCRMLKMICVETSDHTFLNSTHNHICLIPPIQSVQIKPSFSNSFEMVGTGLGIDNVSSDLPGKSINPIKSPIKSDLLKFFMFSIKKSYNLLKFKLTFKLSVQNHIRFLRREVFKLSIKSVISCYRLGQLRWKVSQSKSTINSQ